MFCRIYTTGVEVNKLSLLNSLSKVLGKPVYDGMYLEDKMYSLTVRNNDEYDRKREKEFPDGFLYFKLLIEIDFIEKCDIKCMAETTGLILKFLWENKYPAIVSCSFEEILIEKGGYNNRNLPWP